MYKRFQSSAVAAVAGQWHKNEGKWTGRLNRTEDDWHRGLAEGWRLADGLARQAEDLTALSQTLGRTIRGLERDAQRSRFARALLGLDRYKQGRIKALKDARLSIAEYRLDANHYL